MLRYSTNLLLSVESIFVYQGLYAAMILAILDEGLIMLFIPLMKRKKDSSRPWFVETRRKHGFENVRCCANERPYHVLLFMLRSRRCKLFSYYAMTLLIKGTNIIT